MDDVPWYGVGPSEPTPVPILGPDIIDPRQMHIIRQQAERAAQGLPAGVRELPAIPQPEKKKVPAKTGQGAAAADGEMDPAKAERLRKREAALARKRAREAAKKQQGEG